MDLRPNCLITSLASVLLIVFTGCGGNPERLLNEGISRYTKGDEEKGRDLLTRGVLLSASVKTFKPPFPECRGNLLVSAAKNNRRVRFPVTFDLPGQNPSALLCYSEKHDLIAVIDSTEAVILNTGGTVISRHPVLKKGKAPVMACVWHNRDLLYYREGEIFRINVESGVIDELLPEQRFGPPFTGSRYTVSFSLDRDTLALAAGIAGVYYLYGIDLAAKRPLYARRACSSSRILAHQGRVYYLTGLTGNWKLVAYTPADAKTSDLLSFAGLIDIVLLPEGLAFEDGEGLFISEYSSMTKIRVPFQAELAGQCLGRVLIQHRGRRYVLNMADLLLKLTTLNSELPELFKVPPPKREEKNNPGSL